jgi:hypothetical protein
MKDEFFLGVDIDKVLFADRHWLSTNFIGKDKTFKSRILKNWYLDFVYSNFDIDSQDAIHTLCFRSLVRDDYKELFHAITDCIMENKYIVEDYKYRQTKLNIEASRFLIDYKWVYALIHCECSIERNCLYIKLCSYIYVLNKVKKTKFRRLVCFADMQPVENLITQYFRNMNIETVTLQHGLYVDYGDLDTVNVINYKHCVSEYFLSWGSSTKKLIEKYCPQTKVKICGKPKIMLADNCSKHNDSNTNFCLIVLDQRIFDKQNFEMIKIIENSNIKLDIYVKFHPSNNKKMYYDYFAWLRESSDLLNADLVIGHTTSVIYESLALKKRTLRYKTDVPALKLPSFLEFDGVKEINGKLNFEKSIDEVSLEFIEYIDDLSLNQYKEFFN